MGGKPKLTIPDIVRRANVIHGNKYDYSLLVEYEHQYIHIPIMCPRHGVFYATTANHLARKTGCKKCANEDSAGHYHKKTTEDFIHEAQAVHGDKYDYSHVRYKNIHTKVLIGCKDHGIFEQTPASHANNKNGCPKCMADNAVGGYGQLRYRNNPGLADKPAKLYVVRLTNGDEQFIKVGITRKNVVQRFSSMPYKAEELLIKEGKSYELFQIEQAVKKYFKQYKYRPSVKFPGHTECFTDACVEDVLANIRGV